MWRRAEIRTVDLMPSPYDVVVVGARCAGSPLALQLARAGLSVVVVDRARFPSDTPSTHILQVEGVGSLQRLGLLDRVLDSGAPWLANVDVRMGDIPRAVARIPVRPDDPGPGLCVRRTVLDSVLVDGARAAGVEVREATRVVDLVRRQGRVVGVRVHGDGGEEDLMAPLVVGADGAGSTVARLVGARRYNVIPNQRFGYWAYYEGAGWAVPSTLVYHRWDEDFVIACPTDGGLYMVIVLPPLHRLAAFRTDADASFTAIACSCPPVDAALDNARRVGRLHSLVSHPAFFRESAGPGWVLVGDAGHVTDPSPGQGITDALRQVDRLAPAIAQGLGASTRGLDRAMAKWWRWRDADGAEMHWFAADLGRAGALAPAVHESLAGLAGDPADLEKVIAVFNHRLAPSEVFSPARVLASAGRLVVRGDQPRRRVIADTWDVIRRDRKRRGHNRRPVFEVAAATGDDRRVSEPVLSSARSVDGDR